MGFAVVLVLLSAGCVKSRPDQVLQGSGLATGDVLPKENVLSVVETVTAKNKVQDATTREYKLTIEDSAKDLFDDLGYVNYESESDLLKNNPRFIGKPGVDYQLVRKLQGDRLIVYKVSTPENISYIEKTNLVKKFDDGKIGVPYLSFPVSFYKVRYLVDADNRKTNQKTEEIIRDPLLYENATHILVGWNDRTVLTEQGIDKSSFFPKSFFKDSEWYYSVFKTDSSDYVSGGNSFMFIDTSASEQFGIFRNIKFKEIDQNTFAGISSSIPLEIQSNQMNEAIVAPLKVKWMNLRLNSGMSGTENEEIDGSGDFRDSEYFQIDFLQSFNALSKSFYFPGSNSNSNLNVNKVSEVIIGKDIFSFIVGNEAVKFRVNFMRKKDSSYEELATFYEDVNKKFGTFHMRKPVFLANSRLQVEDDAYRFFRTIRFNPNVKNVVYHISEESPKTPAVQNSAERAIKYIDDSFKHIYKDKPEERIRVTLSADRVKRGDPRYNILDYNSENNPKTYGGLGNPYYDEFTGEVISATTFVYYGNSHELLKSALTEYMGSLTGMYRGELLVANGPRQHSMTYNQDAEEQLFYIPTEFAENIKSQLDITPLNSMFNFIPTVSGSGQTYIQPCIGPECQAYQSSNDAVKHLKENISSQKSGLSLYVSNAVNNYASLKSNHKVEHNIFQVSRRSGIKTFQAACDLDKIKSVYESFQGSSRYLDSPIVVDCIQKVLTKFFVPTVVHEVLHNFGLKHNMHGSTDKKNYLTPEMIKAVYNEESKPIASGTNSIMDYFEYRFEDKPYPSTYDWAVLRYLYRNQIELRDGKIVSLVKPDDKKVQDGNVTELFGVAEFERSIGQKSRDFDYCMQIEMDWGTNPLCDTFDLGDSPMQIVKNYIEEYQYLVDHKTVKAQRYNLNPYQVSFEKNRILRKLSTYYNYWRKELITIIGDENKYLEKYSSASDFYDDFAAKINVLTPKDKEHILEYYQVRNIIYSFLKDQVFKAPMTCVFEETNSGNKQPVFIDFDQIYRNLLASSSEFELEQITNCSNNAVQTMAKRLLLNRNKALIPNLKESDFSYKLVAEVGSPLKNYSYSLYESKYLPGSSDVVGYADSKLMAAFLLLGRQYTPNYGSDELYYPTFMDEPEFRDNFEYLLKNRYLNGFWVDQNGSDLSTLTMPPKAIESLIIEPQHQGFRDLMNTYGPEGAKDYTTRKDQRAYINALKRQDNALSELMVNSPYVHNLAVQVTLEAEDLRDRTEVMQRLYNKVYVPSFLSESPLMPIYSGLFRASLFVPNNLSVTKDRTERFLMGISSNDYAYMSYVRERYKNVADLGSFLVYPKNDEATFAREIVMEVEAIDSAKSGVAADDVDLKFIEGFLGKIFDKYLTKFSITPNVTLDGQPTLSDYAKMNMNLVEDSQRALEREKNVSKNTKRAAAQIIGTVSELIVKSLNGQVDQLYIKAYDRYGYKLTYTEAIQEIIQLNSILKQMNNVGLDIPTAQTNRQDIEKNLAELQAVVKAFEETVPLINYTKIGEDDQSVLGPEFDSRMGYVPFVPSQAIGQFVNRAVNKSLMKNAAYRFDAKEYDEKKELLNKLLLTLAISR